MNTVKILLVDDDDIDRMMIVRMLESCDFDSKISEESSAESAIEAYKTGKFDCVLLDYHLPDMEQLDLVAKINDETTAVMVLTGHGGYAIANEARALGVKTVLSKDSLDPRALRQAIVDAIENLRSQSYLV